jgi:hypothetical protein
VLGTGEQSNLTPVTTSQDLHQSPAQGTQDCRFEVNVPLHPVDVVDDEQVSWVDVDALRALEYGQFATPDIGAQAVLGNPSYLNDALQRPAPGIGNSPLQVAHPRVDGRLGAAKIRGNRTGRQGAKGFIQVPVFLSTSTVPGVDR